MYENITYEVILNRMLDRVPDYMDKREGSVIYDAMAPAAVEMQNLYIELDWALEQVFAGTADRDNLIRRCAEWGIIPYPATRAVLKGEFNIDIESGKRFSLGTLNYTVTEKISDRIYRMECETPGAIGNRFLGTLIPIDYIPDLTHAELTEVLLEGNEEETTDALRERFLFKVQKPSTSGNAYDYYNWTMECPGVGAAKIYPLALGPGTVKVVIADADRSAATPELIARVKSHIEELRPIGADVSVFSAGEKAIAVTARVKLQNGVNLGGVQDLFRQELAGFLQEGAFDISYISLARVGNLLLNIAGVEDFTDLRLNGQSVNVSLADEEIAVAGIVTLEVMQS
ncbi:baseplate J/gp47 family protein [Hungatella sp.]|uniref:baseplate J/gp47 family protein n=1 Tax=Hungatella sp. TaxID=2613924 RepID=UPI002A81A931|nr:baseplate J/gp47 family protein [Hungatella sp.]